MSSVDWKSLDNQTRALLRERAVERLKRPKPMMRAYFKAALVAAEQGQIATARHRLLEILRFLDQIENKIVGDAVKKGRVVPLAME